MYKRIKIFALLIVIPFIFCGCWDEVLVEKIAFLTIIGVEQAPQGNLNVTYAMPVVDPDVVSSSRGELLDTQTNLLRMSTETLNRRAGKKIVAGKIQLILYSKELASEGRIFDINSVLERDPSNAMLCWVVVVDGSPRSLIHQSENLKDKPRPSTYMDDLLERSVSAANINETRVFSYDLINMAPGIDNTAPLIKITDKSIEVKGSALFSDKKMVGTINAQDGGLLTAMMKTLKNKKYTYNASIPSNDKEPYSEKQNSAIQLSQNSKKIDISIKNNKPVVDIYLNLYGYADEFKWDNLNDKDEVKKLNNHVQEQIQGDCQKLIGYMQSIESDPIGIGDIVRASHNSYFKKVDWHTAYKQAIITVHVKFKLVEYGDIQ